MKKLQLMLGISILGILLGFASWQNRMRVDWPAYHGGNNRNHFSPLIQINTSNVSQLSLAWDYDAGGADTLTNGTQMQCNPIIINGILYGVSANTQAFALDAKSGVELWKTNIKIKTNSTTSRGLSYWSNGKKSRIFFGYGSYLFALDAKTGKVIPSFGQDGKVNLLTGIQREGSDEYVSLNTPVTIFKNILIVGTRVSESATALLGDIRGYDAISGKLLWTFQTIPRPGQFGYATWDKYNYKNLGGANSWMGMALDEKRGIVYAPTGSAAFDFYGGNRKGDNLFANCLLALDATTGKRLWHFQTVHHDIWDRDIPAPPNLFSLTIRGEKKDVVSVLSKQGFMFVFDRVTGKPIFPIVETPFPASDVPGELASKTQPIPTWPEPFTRQSFFEKDINPWASNYEDIKKELALSKSGHAYIPVGKERTIFFPGTDGGAQWGGAAVDEHQVMYIPAKENPVYTSLIPNTKSLKMTTASVLYEQHCMSCHGQNKQGNEDGSIPSLLQVKKKYNLQSFVQLLNQGRGRMPSLQHISQEQKEAIWAFLQGDNIAVKGILNLSISDYLMTGYNRWFDSNGYPVSRPPWGTLTAINMHSGKRLWQVPLGEYPELMAKGIPRTGTDNYGGPAVTAGGLVFIAATKDEYIRAFDRATGEELWRYQLPAAGYASPSVYAVDGKQYVVIACGGGKLKTKSGDHYLAFSLN
ncbi:outer membrane protein assembly factor BamB family protein [Aquirufa beregesia]